MPEDFWRAFLRDLDYAISCAGGVCEDCQREKKCEKTFDSAERWSSYGDVEGQCILSESINILPFTSDALINRVLQSYVTLLLGNFSKMRRRKTPNEYVY